nr:ABC transporter ATP-binding protein [Nocardioides perillae]
MQARVVVPERGVDVALDVAAGKTVALLGANGAGKSTLLAAVAGLLRPAAGEVVLDGRPLTVAARGRTSTWVPPHDRRVATLAQDPLLFPHLSARDNVAFGPRAAGTPRRTAQRQAARWLAEVGVEDLADRRPAALSGGQAQRVALARALAADPSLLLLDEPMAALDVAVAPALRQVLRRVLAARTVLVVTHDVLDALLLADWVVVLEAGRVVEAGATTDVLTRPRSAFAARIAGLDLVAGRWRGGAVETADGRRVVGEPDPADGPPAEGEEVVAVFRPTAVAVHRDAPGGSPRNALPVVVTDVEPHGDRVRLRAGDLAAEVTVQAAAELDLAPGDRALFAVKATEVAVHRRR